MVCVFQIDYWEPKEKEELTRETNKEKKKDKETMNIHVDKRVELGEVVFALRADTLGLCLGSLNLALSCCELLLSTAKLGSLGGVLCVICSIAGSSGGGLVDR